MKIKRARVKKKLTEKEQLLEYFKIFEKVFTLPKRHNPLDNFKGRRKKKK